VRVAGHWIPVEAFYCPIPLGPFFLLVTEIEAAAPTPTPTPTPDVTIAPVRLPATGGFPD
jgi:hypothetical protein